MDFKCVYSNQIDFQHRILDEKLKYGGAPSFVLPQDSVEWFSYHIQAMVEELGEMMKADKRWKTHRNIRYEPEEKLDEIADVFITAMNIAIYSGIDGERLERAILGKISANTLALALERHMNGDK